MKTPKIVNAIGNLDDELIVEAIKKPKKARITPLIKWSTLVACFTAVIILGINIGPALFKTPSKPYSRYKDFTLQTEESAIIWPWEYLTLSEKYIEFTLDGDIYMSRGVAVSETFVGNLIGRYQVFGYDEYTDETPSSYFDVYELKHAKKSQLVAVKMENSYYVFKNDVYSPPATLGDLFNLIDLSKAVELNYFSEESDGPDGVHFELNDDTHIWEILKECKNAPFVEDDNWSYIGKENISFSVTSEMLGVYKVAMIITNDGYLWTNAFSWQYLFNIGEDAANKIIKYAKENSKKAEYEPYDKTQAGKITEITDEFLVLDDSILCNNPKDGITYKILLNNPYITRHIKLGSIEVGDIVQVHYTKEISTTENTIDSATSLSEVRIFEGELLIEE